MDEAMRLFRSAREYLTPVLTETAFLDKGQLTPEEFVRAGDHLMKTSPSWAWENGEQSKIKPYLPANKQFLVTRGVPSYYRISTLEVDSFVEENVFLDSLAEGEDGKGGTDGSKEEWFHTHFVPQSGDNAGKTSHIAQKVVEEDEYLDMEDESLALDESTQKMSIQDNGTSAATASDNLLRLRRYDVSITYDNYYRTPRIWLFGYDENGSPLEPTAIFEDIMADYAKRTVTIDPHPHLSKPHGKMTICHLSLSAIYASFLLFLKLPFIHVATAQQ
jgi:ubiquitin-like-conjugating enzyme ATG3